MGFIKGFCSVNVSVNIHPEKNLILQGANVLTLFKDGKRYGMTFAWGMATDIDKLLIMVGGQSVTGHHLNVGDKVGISCLNINQGHIAQHFGDHHSDIFDKFDIPEIEIVDNVYLIKDATREMIGEIIDIFHLKDNNEDLMVYIKINKKVNSTRPFLDYASLK